MRLDFSHLLPIYRAMQPVHGSKFSVLVTSEIQQNLTLILNDDDALPDSGFSFMGEFNSLVVGRTIEITVNSPRLGLGILASCFSEYLSRPGVAIKEKTHFFLRDNFFYSKDLPVPPDVAAYRSVLSFIRILQDSAYYLDENSETLIFYKTGRFEIPVKYGYQDIVKFDALALEQLHSLMSDRLHGDQKQHLLAETVIELTEKMHTSDRFAYLVCNIDELYKKTIIGYNLFSTDFTYEKAKEEVHTFKLESTARLHKIISEIQTQLLGIPIATFVALSQIKETNSLDAQFAVNTIIFFGAVIFCVLLGGLIFNQKLTLDTIEHDIKRQYEVFKKRFASAPEAYVPVFRGICTRLTFQFAALLLITILTFVVLAISLVFYIVYTRPVFDIVFS